MKKPNAPFYTKGKLVVVREDGRLSRRIAHTNQLFSMGRYATKIPENAIPEWYVPIRSRAIWYMDGFLKVKGVSDIAYTYVKENHLFKDDYIYLCYDGEKLIKDEPTYYRGFTDYTNGFSICGNDILDIIIGVEKYSPEVDTSGVRRLIQEKVEYLREYEPEFYEFVFHTTEQVDVFQYYKKD